jgi:hypothetical protein
MRRALSYKGDSWNPIRERIHSRVVRKAHKVDTALLKGDIASEKLWMGWSFICQLQHPAWHGLLNAPPARSEITAVSDEGIYSRPIAHCAAS